jgi:endoglucanase
MNNDTWHGWTYWAAGSWWGKYPLALNGPNQAEVPQWQHLKAFFHQQESNSSRNPPQPPGPAE